MTTTMSTAVRTPPMSTSPESDEKQLNLAREQGEALQHAVVEMTKDEAHGSERPAGDFLVGYAVEDAEGLHRLRDGKLHWEEPTTENAHFEVVVRDGADRRFIPGLNVTLTVLDENGKEIGTHHQPFLWHPWIFHYGRNWTLPGDGTYTLRVHVDLPDFPRHDKINGKRYEQPVDVEFANVKVKTGQKKS